ncbi:MAG: hypothetical protein ACHP91_04505 [Burkholderiales bacterium]|jgi:hypothetical protein
MTDLTQYPLLLGVVTLVVLWLAAQSGSALGLRREEPDQDWRDGFGVIRTATLTLLGLVVGFTFSMSTSRYDLRKTLEEAEANAIGTEYVRADLLPADAGARLRAQLRTYVEARMEFYGTRDADALDQLAKRTASMQTEMWATVRGPALAQPSPITALVVAGLNDVLNSQGYTQAAWWNRIPVAAWGLMGLIAIFCNVLVGYGHKKWKAGSRLFFVLPLVIAVSFTLIADIDAPRHGIIRVAPQNLQSLQQSLQSS